MGKDQVSTPLNEEALEHAIIKYAESSERTDWAELGHFLKEDYRGQVREIVSAYLSAVPADTVNSVTGEQVNFAGWTCNGIHEPGDYSTCNECREACDDLANFYNQMMRNPRPGKRWTGDAVNSVEELDALPVGSVVHSGGREFYKTSYIEHPWILPYGVDRFGSQYLSKHSRATLVHRPESSDA